MFLLLAVLAFVLYLVSPHAMSGGGSIKERLSLYFYLFLIPWLSPGPEGRAKRIGIAALAVAALLNAGFLVYWYRVHGREVERYLSALEAVRPTRFRDSAPRVHMAGIVLAPNKLRVKPNRDRIDAVYTWKMPPHALLRKRLRNHYERVAMRFGGELWERRRKDPRLRVQGRWTVNSGDAATE